MRYYVKLVVSGGYPCLESDETELVSKEYFEIPSPEVVVETKGFGYIKKKELGGVVKATIRGGYIIPEG